MEKVKSNVLLGRILKVLDTNFWKKLITINYFLVGCLPLLSQQLERDVISSLGRSFTSSDLVVDWTVGETFISGGLGSSILITEGFHQPLTEDITTIVSIEENDFKLKIYPNPTAGIVNIELELEGLEVIPDCRLLNSLGQVLERHNLENQLRIGHLPEGVYFIQIILDDKPVHTTRIIKT